MTPRMIRRLRAALLLAAASLLAGCVYDPATSSYDLCCATPYPYYPYAYRPYAPYPYAYPPPYYPPPPYGLPPPYPSQAGSALAHRFAQANVTHDGRLTLRQAQNAHWQTVARNFRSIDVARKGYITLSEIRVWLETHHPQPTPRG